MQACDRCHSKKTRCDRRVPRCTACERAGISCLYADRLRQRNLPRNYVDSMESLVQQLREENRVLRESLSQAYNTGAVTPRLLPRAAIPTPAENPPSPPNITPSPAHASPPLPSGPEAREASTYTSHSSSGSTTAACASEVGYLTLVAASGEARYIGSSSGMGLASIISTIVRSQLNSTPWLSAEGTEGGPSGGSSVEHVQSEFVFPSAATTAPFIDAYFQHTHLAFPLLHRPTFMKTVQQIYADSSFYTANPYEAFCFDMVLAIGSANINRFRDSGNLSSSYYAMAESKMQAVTGIGGLRALKAVLLIAQHGIFNNLRDTSGNIWHLIGIGARICFELGLHLESRSYRGLQEGSQQRPSTVTLKEEMNRRCFWCLYNLDRVASFTLGRPVAIRDEEITVPLPSPLDDDEFDEDRPIVVGPDPTVVSPFLHIIRIRRISGQILGLFYNPRKNLSASLAERKAARRHFRDEILAWHKHTEHLRLPADQSGLYSCYTYRTWYRAVYNNSMLLLYRPSPYMPHLLTSTDPEDDQSDLMSLLNSARDCILSYNDLYQARKLNYSWITLHGIFIAGLAYIYSVARILQDSSQRAILPDFLSIVDVTRACSIVMVAICERWNNPRRSCELFNKLSNAVIQDVLNDASSKNNSRQRGSNPAEMVDFDSEFQTGSDGHQGDNRPSTSGSRPQKSSAEIYMNTVGPLPHFNDSIVVDEFMQCSASFDFASQGLEPHQYPSEVTSGFMQLWPWDELSYMQPTGNNEPYSSY